MHIKVEQNFIAILRDNYTITIDDNKYYSAKSSIFNLPLKPTLSLYDSSGNKIFTIHKQSPFHLEYDIIFENEKKIEIRPENSFKFEYFFTFDNDVYDLIGHQGRLYSIFKNKVQIAWFSKEKIGDYYSITADKDANVEVLIGVVLVLDLHFHAGNKHRYDFGNIGWKLKKFDENWRPK